VKKKILLADDSPTTEKVVQLCFTDEPYEIRAVQEGDEALEALNGWQPDVLLADALLPGQDGYSLCKRAKEENRIPVILLVGTFEPFDFGRAEDAGYDAYLTKPFDTTQLHQMVKELAGPVAVEEPSSPARAFILEFQEERQAPKPGVLMLEDFNLTPWNQQIAPQPEVAVPAVPRFRPSPPASSLADSAVEGSPSVNSGGNFEHDVAAAVERVAPRLIENFRRELLEELRRAH